MGKCPAKIDGMFAGAAGNFQYGSVIGQDIAQDFHDRIAVAERCRGMTLFAWRRIVDGPRLWINHCHDSRFASATILGY